ncbi:MAG: hypothetical protein INR66_26415 [Gordonia polyisoprenivorans]|nr:hypothetical protein [Gordonia polyisoprenivorans]
MFDAVRATDSERRAARPGDEIVAPADVVMDRAFTVAATPAAVWPWLVQLGKQRAGWYLPRSIERMLPRSRRAIRHIDPRWQHLAIGDVIPDYGGREETFEVAALSPGRLIVYVSQRGRTSLSWAILLEPETAGGPATHCRVLLRLRLAPVRRRWLARSVGELFDALTIAGMAAGLRERVAAAGQVSDQPTRR